VRDRVRDRRGNVNDMATILKNVLQFTDLAIGVPAALPHRLNVNEIPVMPKLGGLDAEGFTVTADTTNVTVTRTINAESGNVRVYVEYWHTIESVTPLVPPPGKLAGLTPFFFAASGQDASPIVVEDEGVALPNPPHATLNFAGAGVNATDAGGGVALITVPGANLIFRPGGVQAGNVYTSWTDLMAAKALIQGYKTIQFDSSLGSITIPAGVWDMTDTEWFATGNATAAQQGVFINVSLADGAQFTNLIKIGGTLSRSTRRPDQPSRVSACCVQNASDSARFARSMTIFP
jgi:hypothetical protein